MRKRQSGVMLLEALIAILIFSLGVLGLVGIQASAVRASRDAQFRSDAGLLADQLIGQMRVSDRTPDALFNNFHGSALPAENATGLTKPFDVWAAQVAARLPGVRTLPESNPPVTVTVTKGRSPIPPDPSNPPTASQADIKIQWQAPGDTTPHAYRVVVQII